MRSTFAEFVRLLFVGAACVVFLLVTMAGIGLYYGPTTLAQAVSKAYVSGGAALTGAFGQPRAVPAYLFTTNITTNTTTVIKTSPGVIACVTVNTAGTSSPTAKLYNQVNALSAGNVFATINTGVAGAVFCYGAIFNTGLTVVTASGGGASDLSVQWR